MPHPLDSRLDDPLDGPLDGPLESLLDGIESPAGPSDSLEGQRLHRAVRARLLDETVAETRIDRYLVSDRLGVGGMGVVYAARDEQLAREVAIKLVRGWASGDRDNDQRRLIREARSLAQLSHPNVVAIYDVGVHAGRVFIAMELVRGTTLRQHVAGPRDWTEIARCYLQAGEGLAAAHSAGLVHRDFKPDNVLVGDDGRVRVLDFGLAQGDGSSVQTRTSNGSELLGTSSLTASGKVVGTPAYMAPEQFAGAPADTRTDQFSFCVAFWEGLHGERPFTAPSLPALHRVLAAGKINKPAHPERAPEWLRAVLVRGLAPDPAHRWPSMRALLDACERRPRRWRRWLVALGLVAGGGAASLGGWALLQSRARDACERDARALAAIWNDETAATVTSAFAATGLVHAHITASTIDARLAEYSGEWASTRAEGCLAHVAGTLDDEAWALRSGCLDDLRERLGTLVEILSLPDRDVVNRSMRTAIELQSPSACEEDARLAANAAALGRDLPEEALAALRLRLARSEQLSGARPEEAVRLATAAHDESVALGNPALEAEALLGLGLARARLGDYAESEQAYERAYFLAAPIGADEVAIIAATQLVDVVGVRLARADDGLAWGRHADVLLARMGDNRRWREADIDEHVGNVLRKQGDHQGARERYEHAITLRTEDAGPDNPLVGQSYANLGSLLAERSELADAAVALAEAERILGAAYGPDSSQLAPVYTSLAAVEYSSGRYAESGRHAERVLEIRKATLAPDHPGVAVALVNVANSRVALGDVEGARSLVQQAVEIRRARLGPTHPMLASALSNLGVMDLHAEQFEAAEQHLREALQIRRSELPPGHLETVTTLINLADVYAAQKQYERALEPYNEAVQLTAHGSDLVEIEHGRALTGLGTSRLALGEAELARADFERALATRFAEEGDPVSRCEVRFGLARALQATGGGAARVRELARQAHALCLEAGDRATDELPRIEALMR